MLFKKGVLPQTKDIVADSYTSALEEHRKKIKAKTDEIKKCIKDRMAESVDTSNIIDLHDQNGNTNTSL